MRVVVVAEWYPSPGDPVHGVWAHGQALAVRDAGADVRVLALRRPIPPLSTLRHGGVGRWLAGVPGLLRPWAADGLPVDPVPFLAPPRPWSYGLWGHWAAPSLAIALTRLWRRWPFDVIHAHSLVPTGFAAASWIRRARRLGIEPVPALVTSTHGADVIHIPYASRPARRATESVLRDAAIVVANSRWAARRCEEIAGHPVESRVVHFGTELPSPLPPRHESATLVTVAHLQSRKHHTVVLHALAELAPRLRPDYVVIGDGPGRRPLPALAARLGLTDQVRFLGQLDHADALAECWRCHLYVMPSVEEPFGVAYIEAMAGGLPAIGSRGEGGPEDIAAAGHGMLLVDPDDHLALARLIEATIADGGHLAALGQAARSTVERNFTWRRCGQATLEAYTAALEISECARGSSRN